MKEYITRLLTVIEFSKDEACDLNTLVILLEQAIEKSLFLNTNPQLGSKITFDNLKDALSFTITQISILIETNTNDSTDTKFFNMMNTSKIQIWIRDQIRKYFAE